tara:strand:- start:230 stop:421 length:192 start_codon:yes stop_codon:yes gene_type:complete
LKRYNHTLLNITLFINPDEKTVVSGALHGEMVWSFKVIVRIVVNFGQNTVFLFPWNTKSGFSS